MKSNGLKMLVFSSLLIGGFAFSQNNDQLTESKSKTDQLAIVKMDSLSVEEAKKKAAADEKANLAKPYNEKENAEEKIAELIKIAQTENKNIILQAGGNWCIWCLRFNDFVEKTPELKEIVDENYLYYHLNFSPANKNKKTFAKYGNPGDTYGYPFFIVLNKEGKQIHTQDSSVLEKGKGYDLETVKTFFNEWRPKK